jgi:hypothetical protein
MKIIFTDTIGISNEYKPKPANNLIPEWYKNITSYMGNQKKPNGKGKTTATIKKCMPVFDAITAGYILYTYADIYVSQKIDPVAENNKEPRKHSYFEWPSYDPIKFHPIEQAPNHPNRGNIPENGSYPKWMNPWSIKTPKGYSCLFTQPMHRDSIFTILDGIVDTDTYTAPVNFPFVLNDWNFEGFIPAGTPMAQVVPFKRESWQMEIGAEKDYKEQKKVTDYLNTSFFDSYKNKFRQPKEYK